MTRTRKRINPALPKIRPKQQRRKRPTQTAPTCARPTKPVGPNKITILAKDAILLGIQQFGSDGKGTDGIVGFVYHLCKKHPLAAASLLGRVIPLHLSVDRTPATQSMVEELQRIRHERAQEQQAHTGTLLH